MRPYFEASGVTLYHGDLRDVLPALELEAAAVICDPPYNAKKRYGPETDDHRPWPEWCAWWDECLDVLMAAAPDVFAFLSLTAWRHVARFGARDPDWTLCWNKPLSLAVCAMPFMPHWEPIAYWGSTRKRDGAFWGGDVFTHNVTRNVFHPTEKPLPLLVDMVRRLTEPGDLVVDGFAGSGTTLVAAQLEGRRAVGVEIHEPYCEIIARRLERGEVGARRPEQGLLWGAELRPVDEGETAPPQEAPHHDDHERGGGARGGRMRSTAFAYTCLGSPAYVAPAPARDPVCWLCGGPTDGHGWPRRTAIPETFTNVNLAVVPASDALCVPCAYFGSSEAWKAYVAAHPDRGLKAVHPLSWRSYSHAFSGEGHTCPTRRDWRALLLEPPPAPFLFVIAESGQKHLIFRAQVAYDRDRFLVQLEEASVWVDRARFTDCLAAFEVLYRLGLSRDAIVSGRYPSHQTFKAGARTWATAEAAFAPWRRTEPGLARLAAYCARRADGDGEET